MYLCYQSVLKAWNDACHSTSTAKVLIPQGEWLTAELDFAGPCTATLPIIIELQGTLKAKPDVQSFPSGMWINIFQTGVKIMGGGTLDGQGCEAWKTKKPGGGGDALPDVSTNHKMHIFIFCLSKKKKETDESRY